MTGKPLKVLILEDRSADAELALHELRRGGYAPEWTRVEDEAGFRAALHPGLDLVLADYHQPTFDALRAFRIMREQGLAIPFIIVSGAIGEETAVAAVREGVADYVLKDRLARLGTAVENALEQRALRDREQKALDELRASERMFADLVNSLAGVIWERQMPSGKLTFISREVETLLGYPLDQWYLPGFWLQVAHPDDREHAGATFEAVVSSGQSGGSTYRLIAADGRVLWMRDNYSVVLAEGTPIKVRGVMIDISSLKRTEELTRLMGEVAQAANQTSNVDDALRVGIDRICEATDWAVGHAWLVPDDDIGARPPTRLLCSPIWHMRDVAKYASFRKITESFPSRVGGGIVSRALTSGRLTPINDTGENGSFLRADAARAVGLTNGLAVPVRMGDAVVAILEFFDERPIRVDGELTQALEHAALQLGRVVERTQASRALLRQATFDSLTELPNRALLNGELVEAIHSSGGAGHRLSLLIMDLDNFKEINDSFGHQAGDTVLRQLGRRIRERVRGSDTVARLGGDEFAILLRGAETRDGVRIGREILRALEQPVMVGDQPIEVHASMGIATYPDHGAEATVLMQRADVAMYIAKRAGGSLAVYSADQDPYDANRVVLLSELRHAIEVGEISVAYQPKVSIADGALVGLEALARWHHPRRGWVPPIEFIPLAERTGLIKKLTETVLDQVLKALSRWQAEGCAIPVAVNLSMRDLLDPQFSRLVLDRLALAGVAPNLLMMEITESAAMSEPKRVIETISPLREAGIRFAIDDFGTGYSSLAYLQRLPVQEIKIDRSFIGQIGKDAGSAAIVRTIVDLGHSLGLEAVAEGVEDEPTYSMLLEAGCDTAQGYLISKPLALDAIEPWLNEPVWRRQRPSRRAA